jgi:GntR family transcriptional regulator, L-lactate dehydrogenase operon regulator
MDGVDCLRQRDTKGCQTQRTLGTKLRPMTVKNEAEVEQADSNGGPELFLQPVASYNPFEETLAQLARAIRLGAVAVGDKFPPERELSERLGVSRTTVREAIRGLEQAGYITTRRGRFGGTFVLRDEAELAAQDRKRALGPNLVETLDFRAAVEPGAAALAARRPDAKLIAQMRVLINEMEEGNQTEFVRKNCRLHILLAQAAKCPPLEKVITTLELEVMDALLAMPQIRHSEAHSHAQHREVVDAIEAGDSSAARDALEEHLAGSDVMLREIALSKKGRRKSR